MEALYVLIVLAVLGLCGYMIWGKTRAVASVVTDQNKDQLADAFTSSLSGRKYILQSRSENLLTFSMDKHASCLITLVLAFFFILPAILYAVLGGSTKTLSVHFTPHESGWNLRIEGQRSMVNRLKKMVVGPGPSPVSIPTRA